MQEQPRNKYKELSNEEKDIKRDHWRNQYRNMSDEDKQQLKEYQKTIVTQKNNFMYSIKDE